MASREMRAIQQEQTERERTGHIEAVKATTETLDRKIDAIQAGIQEMLDFIRPLKEDEERRRAEDALDAETTGPADQDEKITRTDLTDPPKAAATKGQSRKP